MNKVLSLVLCFVLVLSLVGCSAPVKEDEPKTDTPSSSATPVYELKSGDGIHTIAFVSDTQKYIQKGSEDTYNMMKALVDNKDKYSIEYVVHTGDIVMNPDSTEQWDLAKAAMEQLRGVIPYGLLAGNHDYGLGDDPFLNYAKTFGDEYYKDLEYFGDSYEDCRAHYQLVTIGKTDFVFVFISDDPNGECIEFANQAFAKHPDRIGVLCTHKYMEEDCDLDEMGEYMMEKIVKANKNVYMVLCGHESAAGLLETKLDDGRTVLQIMADYQDGDRGAMMYLQLNENTGKLTGISYSPITGSYDGYKNSNTDQFETNIPW